VYFDLRTSRSASKQDSKSHKCLFVARAMYRHVEPGEHIPVALYRACAEVLAYVWRMQRWRAQGGLRPTPPPVREGEIEVSRWRPEN